MYNVCNLMVFIVFIYSFRIGIDNINLTNRKYKMNNFNFRYITFMSTSVTLLPFFILFF